MREKSGFAPGRWLAAAGLTLAVVPIALAWQGTAWRGSAAPAVRDWPAVNGESWVSPNEIVVQLKPGNDGDALNALGRLVGTPLAWNSPLATATEVAHLTLPSAAATVSALAALQADSRVEAADVVHYYRTPESLTEAANSPALTPQTDAANPGDDSAGWKPNDPRYNEQWNLRMVKAEEAWSVTRGKGAIVAVIDTGVASSDSKKGKRARDFGETKFVKGYDFVFRDDTPYDDNGHGTHVAGTIAESTDNKEGVAGLAFEAAIMPIKVLSTGGSGSSATIAEAIRWAADHGANVINMSLGGPYPDKVMAAACEYAKKKGVTIICAAGNSGREGVGYPAAYKDCVAVSAVGPKGDLSFYSTWGKQIAIAAPGGDKQVGGEAGGILQNTVLRGQDGAVLDDYFAFQGTSMASPHAAAVAALVVAQGVKDPDDVQCVLQKSAQKKGPSDKYGAGIIDAAGAAKLAANVYGDGIARFWIVAGLFTGCGVLGYLRRKAGSNLGYPFWGTTALAFGLLFPDWLTGYFGMTAHANLIGHSILIPGALIALGASSKTERRLLGWMALGLTLHLGWEFLRGTTPVGVEIGTWQLVPWVVANVVIGFSILLSGLTPARD